MAYEEEEKSEEVVGEEEGPLPNTYHLQHPVQFGEELIEVLTLKANGRAMQGVRIETNGAGGVAFEPYRLAELGLRLAGKPRAIIDKMHPADQTGLGMLALGFIMPGLETGKTLSR